MERSHTCHQWRRSIWLRLWLRALRQVVRMPATCHVGVLSPSAGQDRVPAGGGPTGRGGGGGGAKLPRPLRGTLLSEQEILHVSDNHLNRSVFFYNKGSTAGNLLIRWLLSLLKGQWLCVRAWIC
jgi:hypothetical protein